MQRLQNRALKITFPHDCNASNQERHFKSRLLPLDQRAEFQLLCLMYRKAHFTDRYPLTGNDLMYETRSGSRIKFELPRPTSEKFTKFPHYYGAQLWNTLPVTVLNAETYVEYKS